MTFPNKTETIERWAVARFYFPFMLGPPWQFRRFRVKGTKRLYKANGFECFLYKRGGLWYVHELKTGGHLGEGKTPQLAMRKARYNVRRTPDLAKQMEQVGTASNHAEIDAEEAFRRLNKET